MANENRATSERTQQVNLGGKVQVEIKPTAENKSDKNLLLTLWLPLALVVLAAVLPPFLTARNDRLQKRWEMKREAGRRALRIIDQYFQNQAALGQFSNMPKVSYPFEPMDNKEVREVCNELVISCENTNAVTTFLEILSLGRSTGRSGITIAEIQKLRNDLRTELGFERIEIPLDTVWIADLFPFVKTNSVQDMSSGNK